MVNQSGLLVSQQSQRAQLEARPFGWILARQPYFVAIDFSATNLADLYLAPYMLSRA